VPRRRSAQASNTPVLVPPPGLIASRLTLGGEDFVVFELPANRPSFGATLTAAEREVAALLVSGASNSDIAKSRKTTTRTAAKQLGQIFRKLGVSSRGECVSRLLGIR